MCNSDYEPTKMKFENFINMQNQKEQTKAQLDYDFVIEKAWNNFKSGKSIFFKNGLIVNWMDPRSYSNAFTNKTD
jgi:hypothetical protein